MAIDTWILQQHRSKNHPPALRFYTWSPAAISLGYHQRRYPETWHNISYQGIPLELVRRPSGGRAVLHQGDLTYMVVTSGISGTNLEVYKKINEIVVQGWRSLGVELQYGTAGRSYINNPNCFGTATGADLITTTGEKLIGSAMLRQGEAILQHGSMLISPNPELFTQVFGTHAPKGIKLPIETIVEAICHAATHCFDIELVTQPLSDTEWK
ncbi:MAG: lipoate--protein ligase family protein [Gomphosphaeria aponina SAG 52.96 = DSM 107014]|uniref:Lipoate--protein ligase family protein n=1 Tax=Gomphosphaeria aponina SAG 52.96 = DSM 107014 TaxID=1521640 RepID=A0A941GXY8_9CHRO|nr:lipoate--protein ligase family protein [Gomphosphaeria aponina SAG 52.96 = DSM 107014]